MKNVLVILLAFMIGDCVMLKRGPFQSSYWTITGINAGYTFSLKDRQWTLTEVRGSYLALVDQSECKEN